MVFLDSFLSVVFLIAMMLLFLFIIHCMFCCSNPVKTMHYYGFLDSISYWHAVCNTKTPCVFPFHQQEKFNFKPCYDPANQKSTNIALNGWTCHPLGGAHFFTQDRDIFDTHCRLLKKQDIPYRTLINGLFHMDPKKWGIDHLDINADQDLEDVWGRNRTLFCFVWPRLVAAFYTIEVYPEWCNDSQYEAMAGILGIKVKQSA